MDCFFCDLRLRAQRKVYTVQSAQPPLWHFPVHRGEKFEGYDRVHLPYARLKDVFSGRILPTYYEALKKVTGVYCLTDTCTGKFYIGSATGTEGVAQRWGNYLSSKHGGNVKLRTRS